MRRDLDLDFDPAELVLGAARPLRAAEMFRRFEFRGLLQRVDDARRGAVPAAQRAVEGTEVAWREGDAGHAYGSERARDRRRPLRARRRERRHRRPMAHVTRCSKALELVAHDAKALRASRRADDTMIAAYLIEPGRASYELGRSRRRVRRRGPFRPRGRKRRRPALIRRAEVPRRMASRCARGSRSAARPSSTRRSSCR